MAISVVDSDVQYSTGSADPPNCSINSTGATCLVAITGDWEGSTVGSVSDNKGNTWVKLVRTTDSSSKNRLQVWVCQNPTSVGTSHTLTYTSGASNYAGVVFMALSGTRKYSLIADQRYAGSTSETSTHQGGAVVPAYDNSYAISALVYARATSTGAHTVSVDGSFSTIEFTQLSDGNHHGLYVAGLDVATPASKNPTWTISTTQYQVVANLVFSPTGTIPTITEPQNWTLPLGPQFTSSPTVSGLALNDSARKVAGVFQVPPGVTTHTITRAACLVTAVTGTPPTYRISLQGVDSSGLPDGTVKGGGSAASTTFTPTTTGVKLLTFANSYAAAPGEKLAVVVDYSTGTVNGTNYATLGYTTNSSLICQLNPYGIDYQASWTKRNEAGPFAVGTASDLWGIAYDTLAASTSAFQNSSSPNEYGMKFTVPSMFDGIAVKGLAWVPTSITSGGLFTLSLYNGGGASDTGVLQSLVFDSDCIQSNRRAEILFEDDTLTELAGGSSYRIAIRPNSTQTITLYYNEVNAVGIWDQSALKQNSQYTTRAGGNWTDTSTRKMPFELLLAGIGLASGTSSARYLSSSL